MLDYILDYVLWPWRKLGALLDASFWQVMSPELALVYIFFALWAGLLIYRGSR